MKTMLATTAAILMFSGVAFAQTTSSTPTDPNEPDKVSSPLENPEMMVPFYTDDSMTTMRSAEEMQAAWAAMSVEDQTALKEECEKTKSIESESIKYEEFCGTIGSM